MTYSSGWDMLDSMNNLTTATEQPTTYKVSRISRLSGAYEVCLLTTDRASAESMLRLQAGSETTESESAAITWEDGDGWHEKRGDY